MKADDGKFCNTDVIDESSLNTLIALVSSRKSEVFEKWLKNIETSVDEKSRRKAHEHFERRIHVRTGHVPFRDSVIYRENGWSTFDAVVRKYVEMNVAHPSFMEGNGRSTRIWLDLILKKNPGKCVDLSRIGKKDYHEAMRESVADSSRIRELLGNALTDDINNCEIIMKGIDYSYYYETE